MGYKLKSKDRITARRHLDKRLNGLESLETLVKPPKGWIKAIREALGMTSAQLGKRIGVSQPRAVEIEKAEASGSITLESLERAARALDCKLVYTLVPKQSLQAHVQERATIAAKRRIKSAAHSMALEDQSVDKDDQLAQLEMLARELASKSPSEIWEDE